MPIRNACLDLISQYFVDEDNFYSTFILDSESKKHEDPEEDFGYEEDCKKIPE